MTTAPILTATFPSGGWFDELVEDVGRRPAEYERLGIADCRVVVEVVGTTGMPEWYGLVLEGYDIRSEGELKDLDSFDADVVLSGSKDAWVEMVANIVEHGSADRSHTLNALSIAGTPLCARSADPMGRDKFYRYAETLQTLFDSAGTRAIVEG